jgi:hypothetical protein
MAGDDQGHLHHRPWSLPASLLVPRPRGIVTKYLHMWSTELCQASSKILTPPTPLSAQRVCPPPPPTAGGTHSPGGEGGGGQYFGRRLT